MFSGSLRRTVTRLSLVTALALTISPALPMPPLADMSTSLPAPTKLGGVLKGSRAWTTYRERFVDRSGRVIDTGNGDVSHSEGQGYGMLLAVAADDRREFDHMLSWTRANLFVRDDNLAAWRWAGGRPAGSDRNTATDGDLLIAWALAEAADLWSEPAYLGLSKSIVEDIIREELRPVGDFGMVVMPGVRGFAAGEQRDGPVVNLSYWIFPAFARLAQVAPDFDWSGLTASGLALIDGTRSRPLQLPPDWLSLARDTPAPAEGFEKRFGYDALRIPLYLFWGNASEPTRSSVFANAWPLSARVVRTVSLGGSLAPANAELTEPGYGAVAALARCAAEDTPYPQDFYRFRGDQNYYPATLHLLSLIAATARGGSCLDGAEIGSVTAANWRATSGSLAGLDPAEAGASLIRAKASVPLSLSQTVPATEDDQSTMTVKPWLASTPLYLTLIAAGAALIAGLAWFGGRRQASRAATPSGVKEKEITDAVSAVSQAMGKPRLRIAPRTLPISPFAPSEDPGALSRQIEVAAEACVRLDSKIGLIYFEPTAIAEARKSQGDAAANILVAGLASELRRWLRAADHVEVINQNQIVCCICPLETRQDLESVAKRMSAIVRRMGLASSGALETPVPAGLSMYPVDGYSGQELIDNARRDYFRNEEVLLGAPMIEHLKAAPQRETPRGKSPKGKTRKPSLANRPVQLS